MDSEIMCCIAGCDRVGGRSLDGLLFCYPHWVEAMNEKPKESCTDCDVVPFKCCVKDCNNEGIITQMGTQNHYCITHAWKVDRPDEHGLCHPLQAQCNPADTLRAYGAGFTVAEDTLPVVSESVAEQCKRELEEGKKKGWKRR